ncbi:MAG TPA: hypothetical protein DHW71_13055 [Gammaproteobacteria bacterium]|mgnify:CR=1 FL=1|nr:hypothetical protein [Gammaproteobacteria bacterium]HBF09192.1 hypothetical protein [Gammaproteobacteria bacterium]HCK93920.1 hypothetical protein [Gammaproteobacteria bacterium]|tara:strand:+ start:758 stop:2182 length:1425 start_codon:yes stop_codon:yes gene_type:complete
MHDLYSLLDKHILYPAYYWKAKDPKLKHLKMLEKRQFWSTNQLQSWQLERLQAMVTHAYQTVPFYRELYRAAGIKPEDIRSLDDINLLPCVRKKDIQEQGDAFLSSLYDKSTLVADASGGSTGMPTHFYKDKEQYQRRAADQVRHDRWSGWDLGDPYALIWGAQKDLKAISSLKQRIVTQYIHRVMPLDAFDLTPEKMSRFADVLEKEQPPMILGYANALLAFAQYLSDFRPHHTIRPKGIVSSAEALTDKNKAFIQDVFKTKVLNRYGSREVGLIASECQHQKGLHINADNVFVEIGRFGEQVDEQGQVSDPEQMGAIQSRIPRLCNTDESGELIVTDFWNYGMPFIRYRMGDEGHKLPGFCDCGRKLPLLGQVSGRVSDFIIAMNGTRIHGEYFTHIFYDLADVKQFQLVQEKVDQVDLKVVTNGERFAQEEFVIKEIKKVCGDEVNVNIVQVEHIPPTASGKYLFTISKVA